MYRSKIIKANTFKILNFTARRRLLSTSKDQNLVEIFDKFQVWENSLNLTTNNGLMDRSYLKRSDGFVQRSIEVISEADVLVHKIVESQSEVDKLNVIKRLDKLSDLLCSIIDLAEFTRSVHPDLKYVEDANKAYMKLITYMNQLNTNPGLYLILDKILKDPRITNQLSEVELEVGQIFLKDFQKSGIHLPQLKRNKFVELNDTINELGQLFLTESQPFQKHIQTEKVKLAGFDRYWSNSQPIQLIPTSNKYSSTLLRTAHDSDLRREMFVVSNTASEYQTQILQALLLHRDELAELLNYPNFATMFLSDKMAQSPTNVTAFLDGLNKSNRPNLDLELQALTNLKRNDPKADNLPLQAWDLPYYTALFESNAGRNTDYDLSSYLSVGTVIQGLSDLLNTLFGIRFQPVDQVPRSELWHDSVRKLEVVKRIDGSDVPVATVYLDLFNREHKPNTAAHYTVQCSRRTDWDIDSRKSGEGVQMQLPIVVLTCNFTNLSPTQPSLLQLEEVKTLFHEFGHAIHSILARTEFHNVAGTRCKIDFVELPSILFESLTSNPTILSQICRHYKTGLPVNPKLLIKHLNRPNLDGMELQHQIFLSATDQKLHTTDTRTLQNLRFVDPILKELSNEYGSSSHVPGTNFLFKFNHLYTYSASYYTYLLGRALSSKILTAMLPPNSTLSQDFNSSQFRDRLQESGSILDSKLLSWGGAKDPWLLVIDTLNGLKAQDNKLDRIIEGVNRKELNRVMNLVGTWGMNLPKTT